MTFLFFFLFLRPTKSLLYKLASTNCNSNVASSASDVVDFLRSAKQKDVDSSLDVDQYFFVPVISAL